MIRRSEYPTIRRTGSGLGGGPRRRQALLGPWLLILLLAAALALGFNLLMPQGMGWLPEEIARPLWQPVDLEQAWRLHQQGALFIDARDPGDYLKSRVAEALNLPPEEMERYYPWLKDKLAAASYIVVYGRAYGRDPAAWVAQRLARLGHSPVAVLQAGLADWRRAGHPLTTPRRRAKP